MSEVRAVDATGRFRWSPVWAIMGVAIVVLAAVLRFDDLGGPSLWLDEILHAQKVERMMEVSWLSWLSGESLDRDNGPLYYLGQSLGMSLADDEAGVRLIPAVAGVVGVGLMIFAGSVAAGSPVVGLLSGALLAVSPLHVYYSREGRPYALAMILAIAALLFALEHRRRWAGLGGLLVCLAMALLGALTAPLLLTVAVIAGVSWLRRRRYFLLAAGAGIGLLLLVFLYPSVEVVGEAPKTGKYIPNKEVTAPISALAFDRLLGSYTVSGVEWASTEPFSHVVLLVAVWGAASLIRTKVESAVWVVGLVLLPVLIAFVLLTTAGHWYNIRYTAVGLPAFLVLVALGSVDLWRRLWRTIESRLPRPSSWLRVGIAVTGICLLLWFPSQTAIAERATKPDWRGLTRFVAELALPGEVVIVRDGWSKVCAHYYLQQLDQPIEVVAANFDVAKAQQSLDQNRGAFVLAAGYDSTPAFDAWMMQYDLLSTSYLANIELRFAPSFSTFLADPARLAGLSDVLTAGSRAELSQDFGRSELLLGDGWANPEVAPDGTSFRWATAAVAEIGLLNPRPQQLSSLRLRLRPYSNLEGASQTVEVSVAERSWTTVTLAEGWTEMTLPPLELDRPVELLRFRFGWTQSPRDFDPAAGDTRQLAAAFDEVELVEPLRLSEE